MTMSEHRATYTVNPPRPRVVKIRLAGTPADVEATTSRLRQFFTVLNESPDRHWRDEPGQVARYVTVLGGE